MIHSLLPFHIQSIQAIACHIHSNDWDIQALEFDSRNITNPEKTLFIALKGEKTDGHQYIAPLIKMGVKNFLISDETHLCAQANFYVAGDTQLGFQNIARLIRSEFKNPVIGITGSNGKTIVKEWLAQLLSIKHNVCKSPLSYNSQLGVPYSVSKLKNQDLGIFECGISKAGEMNALQEIVQPDFGIFTCLGDAHQEGFESLGQKAQEKMVLFESAKKIIYRSDHQLIEELLHTQFEASRLVSWGAHGQYKIKIKITEQTNLWVNDQTYHLHFTDEASIENCCHAIVMALEYGLNPSEIQYGLDLLRPVSMRLEIKEGTNGNTILNDSYNNDLTGLQMAIDQAQKMSAGQPINLVLSDLIYKGDYSPHFTKEIATLIRMAKPHTVLLVGEQSAKLLPELDEPLKTRHYPSTKDLIEYLKVNTHRNQFYLVKGARQFAFEQVVDLLEQKQHSTRIEVNLSTLLTNLNYFKKQLNPSTKLMVMVKAFAYGMGMVEVSKLLEINQVDYLAVAYTDEGVRLRQSGVSLPIMVMNPTTDDLPNLLEFELEPQIYKISQLTSFLSKSPRLPIHLKLDTGMHRLGFDASTFGELLHFLETHPSTNIQSILSHLAGADEPEHDSYTQKQLADFETKSTQIEQVIGQKVIRHILNSAGIQRFGSAQFDMVRLGIGLYGFGVRKNNPILRQAIVLKTNISQLRELSATETVGYSRKGRLNKPTTIATIPIGYADGFDRRLSQGVGRVIIRGKQAPVVGNVCMDMTMVDVSGIACREGDEVVIFSPEYPLDHLAERIGTISYELLTHLSERVRRVYVFE